MKRNLKKLVCLVVFTFCALTNFSQTAKIDSLSALLPRAKGGELVNLYLELSKEYAFVDPSKIIYYANLALPITLENKNEEQECQCYLRLAAGHIFSGNFEEGRDFSQKGIDLALKIGDEEALVIGMNTMASYQMNLGNYSEALDLFLRSLLKAQDLGLDERVASIKLNIGTVLTTKGDRVTGLRYLLDALSYYEDHKDPKIEARIMNNIAVNYHYWKDYDRALEFYQKTLEIDKKLTDYIGQTIVMNNIGEIYKDKEEYDEAIPYYQEVIELADSIDMGDYYKAYGWIGLAEVYLRKEEYQQSNYYIGLALSIFEEIKMQEGIATANWLLAQISLNLNYLGQALRQINVCKEIASTCGIIDLEQEAYLIESKIRAKSGDYKGAYENLKHYTLITDTLYSQERTNSFSQARSEMDMTQKQNEIELLQKDNQIKDLRIRKQKSNTLILSVGVMSLFIVFLIMLSYIKSRKRANDLLTEKNRKIGLQHKELLKVNETKDKFMSIIGHDLRNPIGAFKDVIGQLSDFPEMFTDELRQQIINELRDEAESTYFLLDNLLSWAKSQKDAVSYKPERLDIPALVKNNIQLNFRASESKLIRVTSDLQGDLQVYADHNMVNLIFRNLISNAIKFTENGGLVQIIGKEQGDKILISIKDTGVGIEEADVPKIFNPNAHVSTYGTNHEKGSGLGLLLCKEFVETNGGTIRVESKKGQGTTFSFTLKKYSDTI
ncbi:ATP-binding protein [Mangrovibacterium diazotrophicum]|uniref:histidine kinase n=1 Tax=Mangrovibacterium diazotrophicum TaxID=1261403 RepID=A0A419VWZ1_9BACT|nr:tetratricopeptide repeat-containing sensor histidine kinase [Mangrovibacterium diazotrophicum]RKD87755.1 tetratricopeptide repeat protein [Mangrovibacterium diazotrophicum]